MAALIALATIAVFAAGIFAGVIGVATVAIRREEPNLTLTSGATDTVTQAGRWLNAVYVRSPHRSAPMPGPAHVWHAGARAGWAAYGRRAMPGRIITTAADPSHRSVTEPVLRVRNSRGSRQAADQATETQAI